MTAYKRGDVVLVPFPFSDQTSNKKRPAVIVSDHLYVPVETIRRRYHAGLRNFFKLYRHLADTWYFYDNSGKEKPVLLSYGKKEKTLLVNDSFLWHNIGKRYKN